MIRINTYFTFVLLDDVIMVYFFAFDNVSFHVVYVRWGKYNGFGEGSSSNS